MSSYTADEWNEKQKIDSGKVEAERKKAASDEAIKRKTAAEKKPGYMPPSGGVARADS